MSERPERDDDHKLAQVVRLATVKRTRAELLQAFQGFQHHLRNLDPESASASEALNSTTNSELIAGIEPFLAISDATCYRVVSRIEEAFAWQHYELMSRSMLVWEGFGFDSAWDGLLKTVRQRVEESDDGSALVSLVICQPTSLVFRHLKEDHAYVNLRSGTAWDLHLVGYTAINVFGTARPSVLGLPTWRFSAGRFLDVVAHVQHLHAAALRTSDSTLADAPPWRYSGTAEIVSVMAYQGLPDLIDWPSLRSVQVLDADGAYLDRSIGQIVEILSDWREDGPELRDFAPGEMHSTAFSALDLRRALVAVAGMATSGVIGNAVYDLLKKLAGER